MNIPNIITVARIFAVPLVVWLIINGHVLPAFWIFVAAGISDGVDGFIAKRFRQQTVLGSYLDPLADKALLVSIYVSMGLQLYVPSWLVIMVVSRDILIISAVILSWMMDRAVAMKPLYISKANTVGQIMLAALVLASVGYEFDLDGVRAVAVVGVAVLTILSAVAYLIDWLDHMAATEADKMKLIRPPASGTDRDRE